MTTSFQITQMKRELMDYLLRFQEGEEIPRKPMRHHMEKKFGHEPIPSKPERVRNDRQRETNGLRSTRRLNSCLREFERNGILVRRTTAEGECVVVTNRQRLALLQLEVRVTDGRTTDTPQLADQGLQCEDDRTGQHQAR